MPCIDQQVIDKILSNPDVGDIWIAYSGGLDSAVLLHIIATNRSKLSGKRITVVHVDHGLQQVSSQWGKSCRETAESYGIDFYLIELNLVKAVGESIELAARNARYNAFEQLLQNNSDTMLFAHHADDQVETFLQQALRGAGVQGLGGIPESRHLGKGRLFRPFLGISRKELEVYAKQKKLKWIEDPTNQQPDFDRNFLRNEIIPLLEKRWLGAKKALLRSVGHCREASQQIDDSAHVELDRLCSDNLIDVEQLKLLDFVQQKNVLRLWIRNNGFILPNTDRFEAGINALLNAKLDKNPVMDWGFGIIRRYQGQLYIDSLEDNEAALKQKAWDLNNSIVLNGSSCLTAFGGSGIGLNSDCLIRKDVSIRYRQGGERCRPFGRKGSHELKKLFQEYQIPPWRRSCIPLIYIGDEIACVVGYCYCQPFAGKSGGVIQIGEELI